jgi:hypothetical protein
MTRLFIFLISYGLIVITATQMIFYLNYRSLGYEWSEIVDYIVGSADFALFSIAVIILILSVSVRAPSRLPFSRE